MSQEPKAALQFVLVPGGAPLKASARGLPSCICAQSRSRRMRPLASTNRRPGHTAHDSSAID